MKRLFRLLLIGLVIVALGATIAGVSGQVGGVPPGIIVKPYGESDLRVSVWMGTKPHVVGMLTQDYIYFALNRQACVALLSIRPGGVWLLLNRVLTDGAYPFPGDFVSEFRVPGPVGTHYVQAIATPFCLDLPPEGNQIGTEPELTKQGLEMLIRARGLTISDWAADWTQYEALKTYPFPPTRKGYLVVRVVDEQGKAISNAEISLEEGKQNTWKEVPPEGGRFLKPVGEYTVWARAFPYQPDPQKSCEVLGKTLEPCKVRISREKDEVSILFRLSLKPERADFNWSPEKPCALQEIVFDAFGSQPQERISEYEWFFGDRPGSERTKSPKISYTYRDPGEYNVTLRIHYDGKSKENTKIVNARSVDHPDCLITIIPPAGIMLFPEDQPDKADAKIEPPDHIKTIIRDGFAAVRHPTISLPQEGDQLKVSFNYQFSSFPFEDLGQIRAYSFVTIMFVDKQGRPLPGRSWRLSTLEPGATPDPEAFREGGVKKESEPISIPEGYREPEKRKEIDLQVIVETDVRPWLPGFPKRPVTVQYWGFEPIPIQPPPDTPVNVWECAQLTTGKLIAGQFVGSTGFLLYEPAPVAIKFTNNCGQTLVLPSGAPWVIKDHETKDVIFSPRPDPNPVLLPHSRSIIWSWDKRNDQGRLVTPNRLYYVELETQQGISKPAIFWIGYGW